jgi:hypothetical protein
MIGHSLPYLACRIGYLDVATLVAHDTASI